MSSIDPWDHLADESILPSQFYERRHDDGITQLWVACLDVFLGDWRNAHERPVSPRNFDAQETKRIKLRSWLCDDGRHLGGFVFICEAVGVEPTALRKALLSGARPTIPARGLCPMKRRGHVVTLSRRGGAEIRA